MPVLGSATLELNADSAKLEQDLGRAVQNAATLGTAIGTVLGQAVSAGVDKLVSMVNTAIQTGDELNKLSQKTGMSVENLSELRVAANLADVSMNTLKQSVKGLYESISAAGKGDGKDRQAFAAIGLDIEKLRALKPDEMFRVVTEELAKFEDGANRAAIQTVILGRAGAELSPMINELGKTTALAKELGVVMNKDMAEASERFKDNLTIARIASEAMGLRITTVLLPTLEKLSGYLVDNAKNIERLDNVARIADTGLKLLATAGTVVGTVFQIAGNSLGAMAAAVAHLAQGNAYQALKALGTTAVNTGEQIGEAVAQIQTTWEETGNKVQAGAEKNGAKLAAPALAAVTKVRQARVQISAELQHLFDVTDMRKKAGDEFDALQKKAAETAEAIRKQAEESNAIITQAMFNAQRGIGIKFDEDTAGLEDVKKQTKETSDFAREMGLTFESAFEKAVLGGEKLSGVFRGLANDIARVVLRKTVTEPMGNAISEGIKGSSSGVGDWFSGLFRADGGPVSGGQPYIVGERGPELFVPGSSGSIVPNHEMGGSSIVINQSIHVDARSDMASIRTAMITAKNAAVAEIRDLSRRGVTV